jgi:radical SAM protein with 4Fe4S-binding SPASM domain
LRIRDYLELDREKQTRLRAVAVLPGAEGVYESGRRGKLSPFDRAMIQRRPAGTRAGAQENRCYPVSASVCLSHACTHSCSGCLYGADRRREDAFLDPGSFEQLLLRLHSLQVRCIDLDGGGEPTAHPEFHKFAQMCLQGGFELSLLTNGTSLDSSRLSLLVEGFSFLIINLDANNDEVYNRIHHPPELREFQKVLGNVQRVVSKREGEESRLTVGAQIRLCQANVNYMEQMTLLARDLGVDYVQFRINQWAFDRLLPDQIDQADNLISELSQTSGPFPVYGESRSRKLKCGCPVSPTQLIIDHGGEVYPCPHYARLPQVSSIGNIFTLPPEELWFGHRHRAAVQRLREYDCPVEHCRWCLYEDSLSGSSTQSGPAEK